MSDVTVFRSFYLPLDKKNRLSSEYVKIEKLRYCEAEFSHYNDHNTNILKAKVNKSNDHFIEHVKFAYFEGIPPNSAKLVDASMLLHTDKDYKISGSISTMRNQFVSLLIFCSFFVIFYKKVIL